MRTGSAIILGGVAAGTLDIVYAFINWSFQGVPPQTILQSVASGLLGADAYGGGAGAAALGLVAHFVIALGMAAVFVLTARGWPRLVRRPWLSGPLYGLLLYVIMSYVIVPLSAAPLEPATEAVPLIKALLAHAFLVGLPIALFAATGVRARRA